MLLGHDIPPLFEREQAVGLGMGIQRCLGGCGIRTVDSTCMACRKWNACQCDAAAVSLGSVNKLDEAGNRKQAEAGVEFIYRSHWTVTSSSSVHRV